MDAVTEAFLALKPLMEGARRQIEPDFSMRSSLNMPYQMSSNQSFENQTKQEESAMSSEEVSSYEEQKKDFTQHSEH